MDKAMAMTDPVAARDFLRAEEQRRIREIRQIVLTATDNVPVHVDDVVEGGPLKPGDVPGAQGVVVGHQTRLGRVYAEPARQDDGGNAVLDDHGQRRMGRRRRRRPRASFCCARAKSRCPRWPDVEALVEGSQRDARAGCCRA